VKKTVSTKGTSAKSSASKPARSIGGGTRGRGSNGTARELSGRQRGTTNGKKDRTMNGTTKQLKTKGRIRHVAPQLPPTYSVRELVPQTVCGPRTSVQQLFRVEERLNGASQMHLVFLDRHGWYCEHGRTCPAVGEVMKRGNLGVRSN
jgi:hypothetical protein